MNGAWQRFYGFAGRYHIEKAPAAEIEMEIEPRWWWQVAPGFEGKLKGPGEIAFGEGESIQLPSGSWRRSCAHLIEFSQYQGGGPASSICPHAANFGWQNISAGRFPLTLFFTEGTLALGPEDSPPPEGTEVPPKSRPAAALATAAVAPTVGAGQDVTVTNIDLRDF